MMGWSTFQIRKEAKKLCKAALSSLLWAIWKERNRVTFDNLNFSQDRIKQPFISSMTSWAGQLNEGEYPLLNLLMCIMKFFPSFWEVGSFLLLLYTTCIS